MQSRAILFAVVLAVAAASAAQPRAQGRAFVPEDHYALRSAADVRLSPDGSSVAFVERFVDDKHRLEVPIWLQNVRDGQLRRLSDPESNDSSPRWSPDGQSIAFLTSRIDAANPSSTGFLPTAFGSTLAVFRGRYRQGRSGRRISRHATIRSPIRARQSRLRGHRMAAPSRTCRRTTGLKGRRRSGSDHTYGYKSWSGLSDNRRWHIYVVTIADKKVRQLTSGNYQDHSISWSRRRGTRLPTFRITNRIPIASHNYDIFAVRVSRRARAPGDDDERAASTRRRGRRTGRRLPTWPACAR